MDNSIEIKSLGTNSTHVFVEGKPFTFGAPGHGNTVEIPDSPECAAELIQSPSGKLKIVSKGKVLIESEGRQYSEFVLQPDSVFSLCGLSFQLLETLSEPPPSFEQPSAPRTIRRETGLSLAPFFSKPLYKFSLIAGPNSGKSCFLAALNMHRRENPRRFSCSGIPTLAETSEASALDSTSYEKLLREFETGQGRISENQKRILEGSVPPPTPPEERTRHVFRMGIPGNNEVLVEFEDYAGEFVSPHIAHEEGSRLLRGAIDQSDGIILLCEAVEDSDDQTDWNGAFQRLSQFLQLLRQTKSELELPPICLVINKWDRISNLNNPGMAKERKKLRKLLRGKKPYFKGLASFLTALENSFGSDKVLFLPCSAFGNHERIEAPSHPGEIVERPIHPKPLDSFGLEDVIVELMGKVDQLDSLSLDRKAKSVPAPRIPFWRSRREARKIRDEVLVSADYLDSRSSTPHLTRSARAILLRKRIATFGLNLFVLLAIIIPSAVSIEYFYHREHYTNLEKEIAKLEPASEEDLTDALDSETLVWWVQQPNYRHAMQRILVSPDERIQGRLPLIFANGTPRERALTGEFVIQTLPRLPDSKNLHADALVALREGIINHGDALSAEEKIRLAFLYLQNEPTDEDVRRQLSQLQLYTQGKELSELLEKGEFVAFLAKVPNFFQYGGEIDDFSSRVLLESALQKYFQKGSGSVEQKKETLFDLLDERTEQFRDLIVLQAEKEQEEQEKQSNLERIRDAVETDDWKKLIAEWQKAIELKTDVKYVNFSRDLRRNFTAWFNREALSSEGRFDEIHEELESQMNSEGTPADAIAVLRSAIDKIDFLKKDFNQYTLAKDSFEGRKTLSKPINLIEYSNRNGVMKKDVDEFLDQSYNIQISVENDALKIFDKEGNQKEIEDNKAESAKININITYDGREPKLVQFIFSNGKWVQSMISTTAKISQRIHFEIWGDIDPDGVNPWGPLGDHKGRFNYGPIPYDTPNIKNTEIGTFDRPADLGGGKFKIKLTVKAGKPAIMPSLPSWSYSFTPKDFE